MGNCCGGSEESDSMDRNPRSMRGNVCCTDIIVLILFIVFWILLVYIAVVAMVRGDPKRVIYGFDSSGNTCNLKNNPKIENLTHSGMNTEGKSNVFFLSIKHPKHSVQICIEKCPDKKLTTKQDVVDYFVTSGVSLCQYGVKPSVKVNFDRTGPCPSLPVYASISVMSRCIPNPKALVKEDATLDLTKQFEEVFHVEDFLNKAFSDLSMCWREMIGIAAITLVIAFVMVFLMRYVAKVMVWLVIILSVIGSIVGTVLLWVGFAAWIKDDGSDPLLVPIIGTSMKKRTAFLILAIIASICTVVLLLVLFVMRNRIALVVALFKEAGKCLQGVPWMLIQPFITFIIYVIITLYFLFIFACFSNMGTPVATTKAGLTKVRFEKNAFERQFWWIYFIGWVWTSEFVIACQEFVISSSVAIWYFSSKKSKIHIPILQSICILIKHHLGSIAFGSLIITIVKVIKYILMYIKQKMDESGNDCAKFCLKCCICCMWCLENVLKFLHQNAYTVIAIEGTNFCSSAKKAFEIIASNALRVAALNSVGDFVLFLGKVSVMCISGLIAFFWLKTIQNIFYLAVPIIAVCVFSFLIAHVFFSVYEMVVDALLICFCEDSNRNDGTDGREYFMSASLMEFVTDSSAKLDAMNKNKKAVPEDERPREDSSLTS